MGIQADDCVAEVVGLILRRQKDRFRYPFPLNPNEQGAIRDGLREKGQSGLAGRRLTFAPVRGAEGMETEICIGKKET